MPRLPNNLLAAGLALLTTACGFSEPYAEEASDPFSVCGSARVCVAIELRTANTKPNQFEEYSTISASTEADDCDGTVKAATYQPEAGRLVLPAYWTLRVPGQKCLLDFTVKATARLTDNNQEVSATATIRKIGPAALGGTERLRQELILLPTGK